MSIQSYSSFCLLWLWIQFVFGFLSEISTFSDIKISVRYSCSHSSKTLQIKNFAYCCYSSVREAINSFNRKVSNLVLWGACVLKLSIFCYKLASSCVKAFRRSSGGTQKVSIIWETYSWMVLLVWTLGEGLNLLCKLLRIGLELFFKSCLASSLSSRPFTATISHIWSSSSWAFHSVLSVFGAGSSVVSNKLKNISSSGPKGSIAFCSTVWVGVFGTEGSIIEYKCFS